MPQAVRRESAQTAQTMQDKELKRARGAISCAECRRLKLKCDKTVPCKRRGCSAICPNGSLKTGQGTRFVLADTEKLHHKIAQMSDRIRQLEDALALLQSTMTNEPHPLLSRDLMKIKSSIDLHSAVDEQESDQPASAPEPDESPLDQFGTLAIRDDGGATFYGRSAGSERETADSPESTPPLPSAQVLGQSYDNPSLVDHMSNMFPFQPTYASVSFAQLRSCLPHWDRASALFALYLEVGPWFFGVVTKGQVEDEIIPLWYPESDASNNASTTSHFPSTPVSPGPGAPNPKENPHELAVAFMVLCFGALTDLDLPPAPDNQDAEQFYSLSKAAIGLEPLLDRSPSIATVQTLAMMGIYEGLRNKDNGIEATWMLMGMACKMAQSVNRDSARFKLPPAEVQKRRALFWELFITDCWQSLATGRLATFSLPFVDCELPGDPDQTMAEDGTPQPSFPYWKARFGAECVAAVSQGVLTARAPRYSIILDLDRKVRNMELPKYAQGDPPTGVGLGKTMLHFMPINYKELTLQYIHRCFFAHALTTSADPMKSEYAPSFTAGYLSAKTMISSVKQQFLLFPKQICRFWVLWTHAFSSSVSRRNGMWHVMLSSVVTHSPKTKVAHAALLELRGALELFESAASHGGRAQKFLPIIRRLHTQSQHVFLETNSGVPPRIHNDIFRPSKQEDDRDDLLVFSGKTTTVTTKARSNAGSQSGGSQRSSMSPGHPEATSPSGTDFASNPVFADVHPVLISELDRFDGAITAQLQDFYAVGDARRGSQVDFGRMAQQRLRVQVPGAGERQAFGERMTEQQRRQQLEQQQRQQQEEAYRQSLAQQQHSHHPEQLAYPPDQDQYAYTQRPPQAQQPLPQQQHHMQVVSQHAHVAQQHDHGGAYTSGSTSYQTFAGAYQPGAASYDPLPADVPRATAMTYGSSFAPLANGVAAPPYTQDGQRLAHHGHPYVNGRELPPNGHAVHGYPPGHVPPTYTPDFAMHGTAANDPRLQETWDYMTMVRSPTSCQTIFCSRCMQSPDYHHHG
ncbi:fungal-specific transcription factor domain-containing protein [Schizophyllum commune]